MKNTFQKLLMQKEMHMGPINRKLRRGDVVGWVPETRSFSLNGTTLPDKGERWEEAIRILNVQRGKNPSEPWAIEMPEVEETEADSVEFKTDTLTMLPVLGCLKAAEEFLAQEENKGVNWLSVNESQTDFLKRYQAFIAILDNLPDILRRKADWNVDVINSWLKENGFDIQLNPCSGEGFAVASILDVLVEWLKEGEKMDIRSARNGNAYPGVELKKGVRGFKNIGIYPHPIACIDTKSGEQVYMAVLDKMPEGKFGIAEKIDQLKQVDWAFSVTGLRFPMISYDAQPDISWIQGMKTGDNFTDYYIEQAIQQTKFRMNEKGARVQSAVAMSFCCMSCSAEEWIDIDRPFILWIERPGFPMPLFAGVFCEDVWRTPRDLNEV